MFSYINLIRKDLTKDASEFWSENVKAPPDLTLFYSSELNDLSQLISAAQLVDPVFLDSNHFMYVIFLLYLENNLI